MDPKKPSKPTRAARLAPEERRSQLLACAIRAFADTGLGRATHAEVARLAEVSVPTVFVYYPTRETLVDAVLDEVERFVIDETLAPVQTLPRPVPELLIESGLAFTEAVRTHPDHARVWLDWSTAFRRDVWPRYLAFQSRVEQLFKDMMLRGKRDGSLARRLDVDDAAQLLVGTGHMLAQMTFIGRDLRQIDHFMRTLIDGFRGNDGAAAPRGKIRRKPGSRKPA